MIVIMQQSIWTFKRFTHRGGGGDQQFFACKYEGDKICLCMPKGEGEMFVYVT